MDVCKAKCHSVGMPEFVWYYLWLYSENKNYSNFL